jgi:rare lipoprotein A
MRRMLWVTALFCAAAGLGACTTAEAPLPERAVQTVAYVPLPAEPVYEEVGTASWYGPWHQGRKTASGDRFDMNALTAAHPRLPLDTRARVTNLENGRSVEVTVNDRGPYVRGRVIDLSRRAAERLGMKKQGTATVRIEVLPEREDAPVVAHARQQG